MEESLPHIKYSRKTQGQQIPRSTTHNQSLGELPRSSNNIINGKQRSGSQSGPDSRHLSPSQLQAKNQLRQAQTYNFEAQNNLSHQLVGAQAQIPIQPTESQPNPQPHYHQMPQPTFQVNDGKQIDLNSSPARSRTTQSHIGSKSPNH